MNRFIDFIYGQSQFELLCFVIITSCVLVIIPFLFIIPYLSKPALRRHTDLVGYGTCTISVIYAIIIGFTMLYLCNINDQAEDVVDNEAQAISNLYYDAQWLPGDFGINLQTNIKKYTTIAVEKEWPAMAQGIPVGNETDLILNTIRQNLNDEHLLAKNELQIYTLHNIIKDARALANAHAIRMELNESALGADVWVVVIIASILTIILNYFSLLNSMRIY